MTATLYDDPVKMMEGDDILAALQNAYPEMSENWEQAMSAEFQPTDSASQEVVDAGLKTRDFKLGYFMVLEKIVN